MSVKLAMKQILAAVIVVIALGFASSAAQAHSGHHYGPVATASHEATAPAAQNAIVAEQSVSEVKIHSQYRAIGDCVSGCCGNAQCAACGAVLAGGVPELVPLTTSVRALFPDVRIRSGIGPQDLTRPPRSLV